MCCTICAHLDCAVLAARLQSQDSQSLRDNHSLLAVVRGGNTLVEFEALESCRTACSLVRDHAADGPVEDLRGRAVVEGARLLRVHNVALVKEVVVPQL